MAQSLAANPSEERFSESFSVSVAWFYSQLEDRGDIGGRSTGRMTGPAIHARVDLESRLSAGITAFDIGGEIQGSIVDPYLEFWFTPNDEPHEIYLAAFAGYHWTNVEYVGSDSNFVFPDLSFNRFRDNGFFGGLETWLPLDSQWTIKAMLGWWPGVSDANFFQPDDMHVAYALGVGFRLDERWSISVSGARSPIARDALFAVSLTVDL